MLPLNTQRNSSIIIEINNFIESETRKTIASIFIRSIMLISLIILVSIKWKSLFVNEQAINTNKAHAIKYNIL